MNDALKTKLNKRYANSEIARLYNAGDLVGAANAAAGVMWGLWAEIRAEAGLPCDDVARNQWIAEAAARRNARR